MGITWFLMLSLPVCAQSKLENIKSASKTIVIPLPDLPAGAIPLEMVLIPAGTFIMGSPMNDVDRNESTECPAHFVSITKDFYMGKYEVTQAQWQTVVGHNPSFFKGKPNCPVEQFSWDDCISFINKLNQLGMGTFRLPTEAEWEYACRSGTTTRYYWGDDLNNTQIKEYAWFSANSIDQTHEVGLKKPNAWGLLDICGNVEEWCQDWFSTYSSDPQIDPRGPSDGPFRVIRGGSWLCDTRDLRSACRLEYRPIDRHGLTGLRLVRTTENDTRNDLMSNKTSEILNICGNDINLALLRACEHGRIEEVVEILKLGANVNTRLSVNQSNFNESKDGISCFISTDIGFFEDVLNESPIMKAASSGNKELVELLIDNGADIGFKDRNGQNALMKASQRFYVHATTGPYFSDTWLEIAKSLIKNLKNKKAYINEIDNIGETALIKAAIMGDYNLIKFFIENGANVSIRDKKNETAYDKAIEMNEKFNSYHTLKSQRYAKVFYEISQILKDKNN